ncbi:MAG: hypothetical protein JO040_01505 [Gemmatimonadetes bacterium]|nr:hypothetical protein [Gemmatimonadota bacterium]
MRRLPPLVLPFLCALLAGTGGPGAVRAQQPSAAPRPAAPELRVTDPRLAAALERLAAGSPTAAGVLDRLAASGLPVTIGSPAQLAALPDSAGGPAGDERRALLSAPGPRDRSGEPPIAWVMLRAGTAVERAWVAVEVDSVEAWNRRGGGRDADARIEQDLLAILAHEFVAHVGSVAGTRRVADFCDDPTPAQRGRSARALARGEAPPSDGEAASCALRVENRVRRELNRGLDLRGDRALPERESYALDVMNFARARARR